ncbi:hypothetical protein [Lysinibacillus fusiformis]|uniref:hypothetical protein n=1 Tax=Lysinibacillus fusiformis TaxID=28031 RepID=UPI0019C02330|nr:hypothetical protein [Lysinibacillus fusiformis]MBD8522725.1 hypothetical protein [Lysinibacillus fusiformis]
MNRSKRQQKITGLNTLQLLKVFQSDWNFDETFTRLLNKSIESNDSMLLFFVD